MLAGKNGQKSVYMITVVFLSYDVTEILPQHHKTFLSKLYQLP